jgi:predicted permease
VRIIVNLTLPALIFLILEGADLDASLLLVPVAAFAIHFIVLGISWVAVRVWGMERPRAGSLIVATAVGNTGFFGLPLIAASGSGFSLPAAVMYDAFATGIITWTSTVVVAEAYGRSDAAPRLRVREVVRHVVNAPICALALGLAVNLLGVGDLPDLVLRPFEILGAATLPLTMLYAGLMIEVRGLNRLWAEMSYTVVVKLGLSALIGVAIASLFRFSGDVFNTIVIMAAMPTAMMSLVIGTRSGLRSDVLAGAVVVTTILATLTLPLWRAALL